LGLKAYTKKVIDQDVWIMKLHGEQLQEMGRSDYRSTQCDTMHLYIEHLREAAVAKKAPLTPVTKNIEFWV